MLLSNQLISRAALPIASARSAEELTRSVLVMMTVFTGLESSYFSRIDTANDLLHVQFAYNRTKTLSIPEGVSVAFSETLCRRALEDSDFDRKLPAICNESTGAKSLGLQTYASCPVYLKPGQLYGMLCAASKEYKPLSAESKEALYMFGRVIEQHLQREILFKEVPGALRQNCDSRPAR